MKRALLITGPRTPEWFEKNKGNNGLVDFVKNVSDDSLDLSVTSMDRLEFQVGASGVSIVDNFSGRDISEFDLVHIRNIEKRINLLDYVQAITAYVHYHGGKILEDVDQGMALGKLSQMVIFRLAGLPVPFTLASWSNSTLQAMTRRTLPLPVIVKANNAMKGYDNHLVRTDEELERVFDPEVSPYVVQEFVPNDGDFRVLFAGFDQDPLIFKRNRIEGSHLSNTSKGAIPVLQTMADIGDGYELALAAAKSVNRSFTGIDIMKNEKTGKWLLLEANVTPALSTGAFVEKKVDLYRHILKEKLGVKE